MGRRRNQAKNKGTQINSGRRLEDVVTLIESMNLPSGFTQEQRQRVFNKDGDQIAELDIVITGTVGTSTWKMLIECRDRPSEGSAPRSWIQQLIGRRDDLNVDKVMAVSSTGFARGVTKLAKSKGIELRTFESLTAEAVSENFPVYAPLIIRHGTQTVRRLELISPDLPLNEHGVPREIPIQTDCFVDNFTNARLTINALWNKIMNSGTFFDGLEVDGARRKQIVVVDEATRKAFRVEIHGLTFQILSLEFEAEFWIESSKMLLESAECYLNDDRERLADVLQWKGKPTDVVQGLTIIGIRKRDYPTQ
jgi:hypothetical protein